jgi:hypothetical protein
LILASAAARKPSDAGDGNARCLLESEAAGLERHAVERGEDVLRVSAVGTCDDGVET